MKKIARIEIGNKTYKIDLNNSHDLSIPIDINKKTPSFYDEEPLKINYYRDKNKKIWSTNNGASCNVPIIDLNIHCGSTHSECRSHITKENLYISDITENLFIPSTLISVKPEKSIDEDSYHYDIKSNDFIITKMMLKDKIQLSKENNIKALIIRTLPNGREIISKKYNNENTPFFSNDSIEYIKSLGIEHLVVDLPSIDRLDDGGLLGNHRIFWDVDKKGNKNTITEFAIIDNEIKDGFYLLSLNILNIKLDASPSKPLIYSILK